MTAIAGLIENGKVWIGGDSAGVVGYRLVVRNDPKVFTKDEFIIGFTSSFRMGQLLRYYLNPGIPTEGQDEFEYMVRSFIPNIRSIFKTHGYLEIERNVESGGTFLVGWRGKLYLIEDNFQVAELRTPYAACGCGEQLILGSLHATGDFDIGPKERIKMALKAAEDFSAGVRGPFMVISTK